MAYGTYAYKSFSYYVIFKMEKNIHSFVDINR